MTIDTGRWLLESLSQNAPPDQSLLSTGLEVATAVLVGGVFFVNHFKKQFRGFLRTLFSRDRTPEPQSPNTGESDHK